jgi:inner membrane protein
MPSAAAHRIGAAITVGTVVAGHESQNGAVTGQPVAAAGLAALLGTLPDVLEPALHPNHRQFCHSVVCAVSIGYGMHRLYKWKPQTTFEKGLRWVLLIGGGTWLTHIGMDAMTPKSIPFLGRV